MSKPVVLVTGGTGYVGPHVIHQLLEQKLYTVRATVRPGKASKILDMFPNTGSDLQVMEIASLTADHSEALKGVYAVIHVASPSYVAGNVSGKDIFEGAYYGSFNVVSAAIAVGVKKIIVTGTIANLVDPDFKAAFAAEPLTEKLFGSATAETIDPEKEQPMSIYQKAKTAAEKKIWQLAHEHPGVDITVLIPSAIFGPLALNYPLPKDRGGLATIDFIYQLITGPNTYPPVPLGHMIDVRDVAKAHIMSLSIPPLENRDKRFLIASKIFTWKETAELFRRERPEIASRLPGESEVPPLQTSAPYDTSLTEEVLGFKADMYIPWEKTMLDSIDEALRWERQEKSG